MVGRVVSNNRTLNRLAAVSLKKLPDGCHADGGNLYLLVRGLSRSWVFRYVGLDGRRKNMGLGPLQSVSLAEARKQATSLREQLKHPIKPSDPLIDRQQRLRALKAAQLHQMTFEGCANAYMKAHEGEWKNTKHGLQWQSTLASYVYPVFGDLLVGAVDEALILKALTPIWNTKTETAKRIRGRIEAVLDWATFNKYRQGENPARWKGHLEHSLAKPSKVAKVKHHPALSYKLIAGFMSELRKRDGVGPRAVEFLILTGARSGEVRGAKWSEVDWEQKTWVIPADRMKAEREHRVPLSDAALILLSAQPRIEDYELIFSGTKAGTPMSDMTLTAVLKRMGHSDITVHGFRSTFRDWAAEISNYPHEVAEMALAHSVGNKVEASYRRGDLLEKRFAMMNEWAEHCFNNGDK
jgi:integrase